MSTLTAEKAQQIVAGWRSGRQSVDGWESPAGSVFASGQYAEADLTTTEGFGLNTCGTICSFSCIGNSQQIIFCC